MNINVNANTNADISISTTTGTTTTAIIYNSYTEGRIAIKMAASVLPIYTFYIQLMERRLSPYLNGTLSLFERLLLYTTLCTCECAC